MRRPAGRLQAAGGDSRSLTHAPARDTPSQELSGSLNAPVGFLSARAATRLLNAISIARSMAGCAMFLILIQCGDRPDHTADRGAGRLALLSFVAICDETPVAMCR
jgi:hypothetical protein